MFMSDGTIVPCKRCGSTQIQHYVSIYRVITNDANTWYCKCDICGRRSSYALFSNDAIRIWNDENSVIIDSTIREVYSFWSE